MIGKLELNVLNLEIRKLDDIRETILMDVAMPAPYGAEIAAKARWIMTVPRGTAQDYCDNCIKPLIK